MTDEHRFTEDCLAVDAVRAKMPGHSYPVEDGERRRHV